MIETPTFENYVNARTHAWATGSVGATFDGVEYRKDQDDHGIDECTFSATDDCERCRRVFRLIYGDPPLAHPADRVARFLRFYDNHASRTAVTTVAGAGTDHKDTTLLVSDLRYLVEFYADRQGKQGLDAPSTDG